VDFKEVIKIQTSGKIANRPQQINPECMGSCEKARFHRNSDIAFLREAAVVGLAFPRSISGGACRDFITISLT
jgi:hypothetical protein